MDHPIAGEETAGRTGCQLTADAGAAHRDDVRQSIDDNATLNGDYIAMNALAAVVACYGLFADSPAVVIGAMIIATLLGPISGIALALVDGNSKLLRKALYAEVAGSAVVYAIAVVIGLIHRDLPMTNEMLSRTSPDLRTS